MICSCMKRWKVYRSVSDWRMRGNGWERDVAWIAAKSAARGGYSESRPFKSWREAFDWAFQRFEMERQKHDAHFIRESLHGRG